MRSSLILLIVLLSSVGFASGQSKTSSDKLETEIRKLDMAHAEAILKRDVKALENLIAEDAATNHPTNKIVRGRDGIFDLIRKGTINYASFVRTPEQFLFYKDMVVVMGNETLTMAGSPDKPFNRRYTNIWMKRNGKWQLAIRHAHIVCPK